MHLRCYLGIGIPKISGTVFKHLHVFTHFTDVEYLPTMQLQLGSKYLRFQPGYRL